MAEAFVGGAIVSTIIDVVISKMASGKVVDFFKRRKLNVQHLKTLKETLRSVNKVLNDAEEKQITDSDVKDWLDDLKDAVYEADDFLDGMAYEALRSKLEAGPQTSTCASKVRNFFSSLNPCRKGMKKKEAQLEKILHSVEGLVQQKYFLGLIDRIGEKSCSPRLPTTSLLCDSGVYGRDDDKEAIVKLLLSDYNANGKNLGMISIVGMGGIGKTTLAQLVYNDVRVQQWFDLKAWVCVSEEFDVLKVIKDILKEIGLVNCDTMAPNQLHIQLKECLMEKKLLLVLDDVWNDDRYAWEFLLTPLKYGSMRGSKIVVTTRNEKVASVMPNIVSVHHLPELSLDDCWFVFTEHAFDNGSSSAHEGLEEIGRGIVRKCKGLPLAAKTLGGLLRFNIDTEEWEKILESNMWDLQDDRILPALRLSYHYLPSHLKQCFAYCSLFPKDYEFQKEDLVLLWMAEGFLVQPKGKKIEEIGNEYFHDLVSRSFFQRSSVNPSCFIMHDLINDLAKFVSGEFCFRFEDDSLSKPSEKARHVSYAKTNYDAFENFEGLYGAQFSRLFLLTGWPWWLSYCDNTKTLESLQRLERLRVLSLSNYHIVTELPNSIGNLKHLRYLNLQKMALVRLPESVSCLYNLQTLILYKCKDLIELPTNMMKLINLRHLDIRETKLPVMPAHMGNLTKLQRLTDFFVGKQSRVSIKQLRQLQHLQGELSIWNLRNVVNVQDVVEADLKNKKCLTEVKLMWDVYYDYSSHELPEQLDGSTDISQHQIRVLEQLQPHTKVKSVSIHCYRGRRFPEWVGDFSFSNIVSLKLSSCIGCPSLPPLGQLASLKELLITDFDAVMSVGREFCGSCTSTKKPFGSLKILRFERMVGWHEWISDINGAFPVLQELYILECPNLTKALPSHLPSLTTLQIQDCHQQLVASLPRAPAILKLRLRYNSDSMELQKLPCGFQSLYVNGFHSLTSPLMVIEKMGLVSSLKEIDIGNCDFESLCAHEGSSLGDFASLRLLKIWHCPNLVSFSQGRIFAPNLSRLELRSCENLKSLPECMHTLLPSLLGLVICNCPEIEQVPEGGFPSKLVSLSIYDCNKLSANFGMEWDLQLVPCLEGFGFSVETFPEKMLLPSTLTTLYIGKIQNLESLDYELLQHLISLRKLIIFEWPHLQSIPEEGLPSTLTSLHLANLHNLKSLGIQHLTSLEELIIMDCPKLESIPEGLPSSLSHLEICNCPLLAERCQQDEGEDWPKISHILNIKIWFPSLSLGSDSELYLVPPTPFDESLSGARPPTPSAESLSGR